MRKKALFVVLIWIVVAVAVLAIYLLRESSPVKEFIAWALSVWSILTALWLFAIGISGWVIKHDFGPKSRQIVASDVTNQKIVLGDLLLEGEKILNGIDGLTAKDAITLADSWINRTQEYLKKEIRSQSSYFLSDAGLERVTHLKPKMRNRLIRLKDIFERL